MPLRITRATAVIVLTVACVAGGAAATLADFSSMSPIIAAKLSAGVEVGGYSAIVAAKEGTAVRRKFAASVPDDLADASPAERKDRFLSLVLPLVLAANEEIAGDRAQLLALSTHLEVGGAPSAEQADWLVTLARHYEVPLTDDWRSDVADLLYRVDEVPPSLALAQAALESGWGTSRFAREGNALFGERTWGENGLREIGAAEGARHRARSFDRLLDGVAAYMHNLNTHPAYGEFRKERAAVRATGDEPRGIKLVGHLTRYSERGNDYTTMVRDLIRANRLGGFDDAILVAARGAI